MKIPDRLSDRLLTLQLDVTDEPGAAAAVRAAVERFGGVDVLVNNAGYGQLGAFEEQTADDARRQFDTNVFGVFNVTRAVLPEMRRRRAGRIFNLSSIAGIRGGPGGTLYSASKFAVEGFSESLATEVAPFGIFVTIVEPGFFRTDFLDPSSVRHAAAGIEDYAAFSEELRANYGRRNHTQAGDPARLAAVMLDLASRDAPPLRFPAGSDAVKIAEDKIESRRQELEAWRALSATTDGDFGD